MRRRPEVGDGDHLDAPARGGLREQHREAAAPRDQADPLAGH
jgi:hypothetical protein